MTGLIPAIAAAALAGAMIPLGAMLAKVEHIRPNWLEEELRHGVTAFGGGLLLSVVAFLLVPIGTESMPAALAVTAFVTGGVVHFYVDRRVEARRRGGGHLIALVSDYLPEAMALGAMFALNADGALLLALMIGLQNLPEGFTAYRDHLALNRVTRVSPWPILGVVVLMGAFAVVVGHVFLAGMPTALGAVLMFAAGGIFYLVFQDIASDAHMERAWAPALGAVAGFAVGMIGHHLLG